MDDPVKTLIELAEGVYVTRDVLNVVEKIQAYDPNLSIKYCVEGGLMDAPYVLVELCPDGIERIVFPIWELDERILERLYLADNLKHDIIAGIDNTNALAQRALDRRYEDRMDSADDIMEHYLKSPKTTYSFKNDFDEKVTIDSQPGRVHKVE